MMNIEELANTFISPKYKSIDTYQIKDLSYKSDVVEITPCRSIDCRNIYFKEGFEGTSSRMFTRQSLLENLLKIASYLEHYNAGLMIFDAFRSNKTQLSLFNHIKNQIKKDNPNLTEHELMAQTRTFVAHPDEKTRFKVSPHNSGGAIDLAIFDIETGNIWDFGCDFDDPSDVSRTTFFESDFDPKFGIAKDHWLLAQKNRRILFHLFCAHGFVNYEFEWWHYDLGDCIWANAHATDYLYESMENEVLKLLRNN